MFTDGTLSTFKEIMNEVFYDWGMTKSPQINEDTDGFWINKTSLFKKEDKYYLTYKTTCFEVEESAFNSFSNFYHNLYKGDTGFEAVLEDLEGYSDWHKDIPRKEGMNLIWGNFSLLAENFKYIVELKDDDGSVLYKKEVSKVSYQKMSKFFEMLGIS